jgi:hypothetical protein
MDHSSAFVPRLSFNATTMPNQFELRRNTAPSTEETRSERD